MPSELPGDPSEKRMLDRIIRVDHAGEFGAKRIYEGQLAALKGTASEPVIAEMKAQELVHLETFEQLMRDHRVRPTALMPLWDIGGFLLGAVTGKMGEKAAMACTVAVEEVIEEHYRKQETSLEEKNPKLQATLAQFRKEEQEHHDTGLAHGAEDTPFYRLLHSGIRRITRTAIWLSERV